MRKSPGSATSFWRRWFPWLLSLALVGLVFAVDLSLPLGVAAAVPYTFAVLLALADRRVAVPLYGAAESLNVATAATVCLYASAMAAPRRG